MNCEEARTFLPDLVLGEVTPEREKELRLHLAGCPGCRREMEELASAWESLARLEEITFPDELSRKVMEKVAGKSPDAPPVFFTPRFGRPVLLAAACLLLAAGIYLLVRPRGPAPREITVERSASTFLAETAPGPDLGLTLDEYLDRSRKLFRRLQAGEYVSWNGVISEIMEDDLQGRANYLLENLPSGDPALSLVGAIHDATWRLLEEGRDRRDSDVGIPDDLRPGLLLKQIRDYRENTARGPG